MKIKRINIGTLLHLLLLSFLFTSCDMISENINNKTVTDNNVISSNVDFSPDYKHFSIDMKIKDLHIPYSLSDSSEVNVKTTEYKYDMNEFDESVQSKLIKVLNVKAEKVEEKQYRLLALVDLTLNQNQIETQLVYIRFLRTIFGKDDLYVAFMKDNTVSESMPVTDYVLNNYFTRSPSQKLLYQSIITKIDEIKNIEPWQSVPLDHKAIVTFSDGDVYDTLNKPIDKNHFELQKSLIDNYDSINTPQIFYVNIGPIDGENYMESASILKMVCDKTNADYMDSFDGDALIDNMINAVNNYSDYRFSFENPDSKIYRGYKHYMQIDFYHADTLLLSTQVSYFLGSIYKPIIVNGYSTTQVVLQGLIIAVVLIVLIYIVFQFIIPAVRYTLFKKKYLTYYSRHNMIHNGILVEKSCYYCKAPFKEGDAIVAKCSHVLHESCWEENGYKCPEYGRKCTKGSHYYNKHNLFDSKNASFYLSWIITAILAGLLAWIVFLFYSRSQPLIDISNILLYIRGIEPNTKAAVDAVNEYGTHLYYLPSFGVCVSFFITLLLSILVDNGRHYRYKWLRISCKTILSTILGYVFFVLGCIISISLNFDNNSLLIDWLPWSLTSFLIATIVCFGSPVKLRKSLIIASILLGLLSLYTWLLFFDSFDEFDIRILLFFTFIVYSLGLAISIAVVSPKSEHYFLHVVGPVKEMDIALYKWMNNVPLKTITIGKSVNCDLQLSWDMNSDIAPQQAHIEKIRGNLYLVADDEGVFVSKKRLKINAKLPLYHGTSFKIGRTSFMYVEKDL